MCTAVRGTLIISSIQSLKRRGHFDRYRALLLPAVAEQLVYLASPEWLPIAVAEAHYGACEALALAASEAHAIGAEVAPYAVPGVRVLLATAKAGGVTPWTLVERGPAYWRRMYVGSSIECTRVGPKDGVLTVRGNPLARFAYWRTALAGIVFGLSTPLCRHAFVNETNTHGDGVVYRLSWA